jgi:uncharacterized membrane protein required for colicin V production
MNVVDLAILIVVGLFAVGGLRRGFLLGLVDLAAFGLALIVAARMADSVAEPLVAWGIPPDLAAGAAFFLVFVVGMAIIGFVARVLLSPFGAISSGTPLGWANSVLGLIPGAIRGLGLAAVLVLILTALPVEFGAREAVAGSRLAEPLDSASRQALVAGLRWAGIDPLDIGLLQRAVVPEPPGASPSAIANATVDPAAESALLDLINQERALAGLEPLAADADLAQIARRRGRALLEFGELNGEMPGSGNAADRLRAAGLSFTLSAENIARAPTVELAHESMMDDPPQRANILNPGFSHVGVGVLRGEDHSLVIAQEFGG